MRVYVLWLVFIALMIYAWRDWFISLCGLIFLSFVMQRDDFPSYLLGINGLNPWNCLFLTVCAAWFVDQRRRRIDLPPWVRNVLIVFAAAIFVAYLRAVIDTESMKRPTSVVGFTGEFLINRIKFFVPGLMLFTGCLTRRRAYILVGTILLTGLAYAAMVCKKVPIESLLSGTNFLQYRQRIDRQIGLMAIDMSMLLAGMFWTLVVFTALMVKQRMHQLLLIVPMGILFVAMALCHSRGSYVGFAAAGFLLALVRWRKLLILLPLGAAVVVVAMPSVPNRLLMGIGVQSVTGEQVHDMDEITAGRMNLLWPVAMRHFINHPIFGSGGVACERTSIRQKWEEQGDSPTHPHNAYLEVLVDMGLVGFIPTMLLYGGIFVMTLRMFRDKSDPFIAAIGGMGLVCITVLMSTAMGAESFYPGQSTLPYWCLWGVALRVAMEQARVRRLAAHEQAYAGGVPAELELPQSDAGQGNPWSTSEDGVQLL